MKKRILSILTAIAMICSISFYISPVETHAASQPAALVDIAKSQLGVKERSSGSDDIKYNDWYYGRRVSNSYSGQYAWCAAFVSWCASQAGIPQSIIPKTAGTTNMKDLLIRQGGTAHLRTSGYRPVHGDIIFFGSNAGTHVGIVDYTSGDMIYYIDGNNTQTNPHGVHYSSRTFSRTDVWGFVTPNYSGSSAPSAPPTNPTIRTSQYWYDLQDTIEVIAHADGATSYFMSFYKDDKLLYQQGVSDGKFSIPASRHGKGKYSAHFSCSNSLGDAHTGWISFEVVGAPGYKDIHVSKNKYDLSDTVEIWVDSVCAKSSVISVFNSATGQKLLTEKTSNDRFKIAASKLGYGKYSAYFSVTNGSGSVDTKWLDFEIAKPAKPANPTISTSQYWYDLKDAIEVTAHADGATSYFMSFYKDDKLLYQQGVSNGKFSIPAAKHGKGKYSAYFSCSNNGGTVDTKWVTFEVVGAPGYKDIHVSKNKYDLSDTVELWVDSVCAKSSVISIFNAATDQKLLTEKTSNDKFKISAKQLGYGSYSAYFTVVNGSGSTDTKWLNFEITQPEVTMDLTKPIIINSSDDADDDNDGEDADITLDENRLLISGPSSFKKTYGAGSFYLNAKASDGSELCYESDHSDIVEVDDDGLVTLNGTGKAVVTITAKGTENLNAIKKNVTITVVPKRVSITKVASPRKGRLKVAWKKDAQSTGYQVIVARNSKFTKGKRTSLISRKTTRTKTFTGLKKRTMYYVKVRAYKRVDGRNLYGAYSNTMRIKIR